MVKNQWMLQKKKKKKKKKKKVIDAAKSTSKRAIQKSAEATRDLS